MKFSGNCMSQMLSDLEMFVDSTEYKTENFEECTFLYAKGEDDQTMEVMQYDPIRPCDQEEFLVDGRKANHKPIRLSFSQIPSEIRHRIDPEFDQSTANLAFMFDEGAPEERIYFVDPTATHSMSRLPIEKADPKLLTHARIQLLAENLLYYNKNTELAYDEEKNPASSRAPRSCKPCLTLRKDLRGFKHVVGFLAEQNPISIREYVAATLEAIDGNLVSYKFSDKRLFILIQANIPGNYTEEFPCYALYISDSGYGQPTLSAGWMTAQTSHFYLQSDMHVLQSKTLDALQKELKETLLTFRKGFEEQTKNIEELKNTQIVTEDISYKMMALSYILSTIPQWSSAIGSKKTSEIMNTFEENFKISDASEPSSEDSEQSQPELTEYELRKNLFLMAHDSVEADYAKQLFSDKIAAQVLGIVKTQMPNGPVAEVIKEAEAASRQLETIA